MKPARNSMNGCSRRASQTRAVLSLLAVASLVPSGLYATPHSSAACPRSSSTWHGQVRVPGADRLVVAGCGDGGVVGAERHAGHGAGVPLEFEESLASMRVPKTCNQFGCGQQFATVLPSGLKATPNTADTCPRRTDSGSPFWAFHSRAVPVVAGSGDDRAVGAERYNWTRARRVP